METIKRNVILFLAVILLGSCASSYKSMNPKAINYVAHDLQGDLSLSYKYDILQENGNKKYAKKEDKKGVRVVAIRLTNNTDRILNVAQDVAFYSGESQIFPMEPQVIKNMLKQPAPAYLLYMFLTPVTLNIIYGTSIDSYPVGLFLGPGLTLLNVATAGSANNKFMRDLTLYDILYTDIQPGESAYGIIGIRDSGFNPLYVEVIRRSQLSGPGEGN